MMLHDLVRTQIVDLLVTPTCNQMCAHTENADINAAKNILSRFATGKYGTCYKPENQDNLSTCKIVQV